MHAGGTENIKTFKGKSGSRLAITYNYTIAVSLTNQIVTGND